MKNNKPTKRPAPTQYPSITHSSYGESGKDSSNGLLWLLGFSLWGGGVLFGIILANIFYGPF